MNKTVFIVDDDSKIRDALQWLFESIQLPVETFVSASHFLEQYTADKVGCLITDVRMPGMSGLELLDTLKLKKCQLPIIVITAHGDIPMAVRAIKAGAVNFITKPFNEQQLIDLIHELFSQQPVPDTFNDTKKVMACFDLLTPRESDILALLAKGKLNKQIAFDLDISQSTVEISRSKIMKKMQTKTLAQLIRNYVLIENSVTNVTTIQ